MTPVIPQLDPLPLPAPAALLWFLLLLTFFLHVVAMNAVLGGSIISAFARRRAVTDPFASELTRLMAKSMPVAIAATVTLGVAALLFLQVLYGRLFFTSAILMAWIWLAVVPMLIVAYYGAYAIAFRPSTPRRALPVVAVALVVAVAFIYSNNMSLMLRPEAFRDLYLASGRGWHLNLGDRVLYPRFLHMVTGAIAVAGLLVATLGAVRRRRDEAFGAWAIAHGARWCMIATTVNFAIGVWFLGVLPVPIILMLIGKSPLAAAMLAMGIVAAAAAVVFLMTAVTSAFPGRRVGIGAITMALSLALMLLVRDFVRSRTLDLAGVPRQAWVVTEWAPIALFGALLLSAIALVTWMTVVLVKSHTARTHEPVNP